MTHGREAIAALRAELGEHGLERILERAAARLERNGLQPQGRVRLERLSAGEVCALSGLLGTRWRPVLPGATATVGLDALDGALRNSRLGCTLVDAAGAMRGTALVDRRGERTAAHEHRERGWGALAGHPALARHPALAGWLERERTTGAALRTAGAAEPSVVVGNGGSLEPSTVSGRRAADRAAFELLDRALCLVALLPVDPPQTIAQFAAAQCGGDPHALDAGRPLDALVRRALVHLVGNDEDARRSAERRRELYDRWGLCCDELSSTVVCHGFGSADGHPVAAMLRASAARGEPRVVTLRELRGLERLSCGPVVFTCENPAIVAAAADELGPSCPPLVCTAGWPSTACLRLLRAVVASGSTALHHGDMDREGLRIVQRLLDVTGGGLWRMTPAEHAASALHGAKVERPAERANLNPELAALAAIIARSGIVVREEQMLATLLADLRAGAGAVRAA